VPARVWFVCQVKTIHNQTFTAATNTAEHCTASAKRALVHPTTAASIGLRANTMVVPRLAVAEKITPCTAVPFLNEPQHIPPRSIEAATTPTVQVVPMICLTLPTCQKRTHRNRTEHPLTDMNQH
jgi:hypothetical protein